MSVSILIDLIKNLFDLVIGFVRAIQECFNFFNGDVSRMISI